MLDRILLQRTVGPATVAWAASFLTQRVPHAAPLIQIVNAVEEAGMVLLLVPTEHTQELLQLSGLDLGGGDVLYVTRDSPLRDVEDDDEKAQGGDPTSLTAGGCILPSLPAGAPTGKGVTIVLLDRSHVRDIPALQRRVRWFDVDDHGVTPASSIYPGKDHATKVACAAAGTDTGYATEATIWSLSARYVSQIPIALKYLLRSGREIAEGGPILFLTASVELDNPKDPRNVPPSPADRMIDFVYGMPDPPGPRRAIPPPAETELRPRPHPEIACVVAAGNNGTSTLYRWMKSPSTARRAITVGGWAEGSLFPRPDLEVDPASAKPPPDRQDKPTLLASYGTYPVHTTGPIECWSGTSLGAGFVAGTIALWLELKPHLRPFHITKLLEKGVCIPLTKPEGAQGAGAFDAVGSLGVIPSSHL